ncbi:MAG: SBBP repeat-containing protein [Phycisphaerae bacterium]|jgi:hypothetical protein
MSVVSSVVSVTRSNLFSPFSIWAFAILIATSVCSTTANAQEAEWAFGGADTNIDQANDVALDSNGNVYATGVFRGSITIGTTTFTTATSTDTDLWVAKFDPDGNVLWAHAAGSVPDNMFDTPADVGEAIAVDADGNCYLAGFFTRNSITFGSVTLIEGDGSFFLVKYDPGGNVLWVRQADSVCTVCNDPAAVMAVDGNGNVFVTGIPLNGDIDFGPFALSNTTFFFAKYDTDGTPVWAVGPEAGGSAQSHGVAVDGAGNVYLVGRFSVGMTIGALSLTPTDSTHENAFIAKFDALGNPQWLRAGGGETGAEIGTTNPTRGRAIAADSSGNCLVTGYYQFTTDFGPYVLNDTGHHSVFVAKYDTNGNALWAQSSQACTAPGVIDSVGLGIAVDQVGNAYVTGQAQGPTSFGPLTIASGTSCSGSHNIFIVKYDADGNVLSAQATSGGNSFFPYAAGNSISARAEDEFALAGLYTGSGFTIGNIALPAAGSTDAFVAKFGPADTDGDGIPDADDNCPDVANPSQENGDGDDRGDLCDPCPSDPTDSCIGPNPFLTAHYDFNDVARTAVSDSTPYGNDGTVFGATFSADSPLQCPAGTSLLFAASSTDRVEVPDHPSLRMQGALTIEAHVKIPAPTGTFNVIVGKQADVPGSDSYVLYTDTTGAASFSLFDGTNQIGVSGANVADGQWHHVAGVLEEGMIHIYVDGQLGGSTAFANPIAYAGDVMSIGNDLNGAAWSNAWSGYIDEVRLYNCALLPDELMASALTCTTRPCNADIPTVSEWGMIVLALLTTSAGTIFIARRRVAPAV